jgi:simple sugar transport system permease protein
MNIIKSIQIILFIVLGLLISSFTFLFFKVPPGSGLSTLLYQGFGTIGGIAGTLQMTIPLLIIGVALTVPFTAKFWNIGAQGQFILGEIFATWIGLELVRTLPPFLDMLVAAVFGFIGGAIWAMPPTIMKLYRGANEVITTLMMNFVAVYLLLWLVSGPMEGAQAKLVNAPASAPIPTNYMLPTIPGTTISSGIIIAVIIAIFFYWFLRYTNFGYELKLIGQGENVALYSGVRIKRNVILSMIISGGISGIAGMIMVYGITQTLIPQFFSDVSTSFGYVGIAVAMIASLNPIAVIFASIFLAGILNGAYVMEAIYSVPIDVVISIYGIVMIFSLVGVMIDFEKLFRRRKIK